MVVAQFPCELALADVHGMNFRSAGLQQAVREAAGRSAEVNGREAGDVKLEVTEGVFEFLPAAADIFFSGNQREVVFGLYRVAGFGGCAVVDFDLAGHDGTLRLLAACA